MSSKISSLNLGLCRIDLADMDGALEKIKTMRANNIKGYVVTPNIDHLARLAVKKNDSDLRDIYFNASLSLCDSRILELMLKAHGRKIPEVVTGSDLTAKMFDKGITENDRVYILGGDEKVLIKIKNRFSHIKIVHRNPSMGFINRSEEVNSIVDQIVDSKCDYIFLAVGSPQQEIIAKRLFERSDFKGITLCIGASILFLAGSEKRAPGWIQRLRLEWLYRIFQNPSRMAARYIMNALRLPTINRQMATSLDQPIAQ